MKEEIFLQEEGKETTKTPFAVMEDIGLRVPSQREIRICMVIFLYNYQSFKNQKIKLNIESGNLQNDKNNITGVLGLVQWTPVEIFQE